MRISEEQIKLLSSGHVVDSLDIEAIVGGYYNTRYGAGIRSPLTYDEAILQMVLGKKWKKKAMFKKMPVNEKDIIPFSQHQLRDQFDQNKILYTWAKGEKTWAKGKRKIQKRHH